MLRPLLSIVLLVTVGSALLGQQLVPQVLRTTDQFDKVHDVCDHRGDVVVLIYGDRKSADANKALGALLHVAFHPAAKGQPAARARTAPVLPVGGTPPGVRCPDVITVPVACIGPVPPLVRSILRAQIRTASPDVPVWLDFADQMKKQFGLQPGVPNVVVCDVQGRARYTAGTLNPSETQRLVEYIQVLRREATMQK